MKARIKEVKYADGKVIYKAQSNSGLKSCFRKMVDDFIRNPLLTILFIPLFLIVYFILGFIYYFVWNESEYNSLSEAQKHIDDIYEDIKIEKEKKEKQKLAKKIVSKTYIKYP